MKALAGAFLGAFVGVLIMMGYSPNEVHPWMASIPVALAIFGAAIAR